MNRDKKEGRPALHPSNRERAGAGKDKKRLWAAGLLIFFLLGVAMHAVYSYRRYNVILITIDTMRPDYLSCYNPKAAPTPNIDRIAENGVLFTHAYSLIPITMPSHTSILTSREPTEIGLFNNGDRFEHKVPMISEILKRKGYTTGAFVSLGVLGRAFGLAGGFDAYNDDFSKTNGRFYKVASEVNAVAIPWIEQNSKRRFFAWIHYSDPHEPYIAADAPPDTEIFINGASHRKVTIAKKEKVTLEFIANPGENTIEFRPLNASADTEMKRFIDPNVFVSPAQTTELTFTGPWIDAKLHSGATARYFQTPASMRMINRNAQPQKMQIRFSGGVWDQPVEEVRRNYGAEVQYTDRFIGELWTRLDRLHLLNRTIIVVTGDHGEGLKTHGILGHVDRLWNEIMHVPLIVYYPNLGSRGKKIDKLTNLLDIMPTVLDLLHVKNNKLMEGQSLKYYVSRSPIDWMVSSRLKRNWTFASTFAPEAAHNSFAITDGKLKVMHTPLRRNRQWEAYDLARDPIEKKNLLRGNPKMAKALLAMRDLLEAHRKEEETAHNNRKNPMLNPEEEQVLRNLGYVAGEDKN